MADTWSLGRRRVETRRASERKREVVDVAAAVLLTIHDETEL